VTRCQTCHERDAVVHLTEVVDGTVLTVHLCGQCAAERGIATDSVVAELPLGTFLAELASPTGFNRGPSVSACPECGATLAEIQASGRVGCPTCWVVFERPLRDLVRRYHGASRHLEANDGPEAAATGEEPGQEVTRLRARLRHAIATEAFEEAAAIRDRLRALEEAPDGP
jgi:protein arginine kinase activator